MRAALPLWLGMCAWQACATAAAAATLQVGPDAALKTPSAAAALAQDGDTVTIAPGTYFDCAIWQAGHLVVQGAGPGVVLTDKACEDKASFVIRGDDVTLRGLTFTRVRVSDRNGAGVRAEGGNLSIEHSRFINNQIGIMAAASSSARLVLHDCEFAENGLRDSPDKTADVMAEHLAVLRIQDSHFRDAKGGTLITSHALRTELVDNRFSAAGKNPAASLIAVPYGGTLVMDGNAIDVPPDAAPNLAAVFVADDVMPAGSVAVRNTRLDNQSGTPVVLLRNWGSATPTLEGNVLQSGNAEVSSSGTTRHWLSLSMHRGLDWLRGLASDLRHFAGTLLRRLQMR